MQALQLDYEPRQKNVLVLGITGSWAFAAGTLLLALRRHNPDLGAEIVLLHDQTLQEADKSLFHELGCHCTECVLPCAFLNQEALQQFSALSLAKFFCFDLLKWYDKVLWLDADVVVQDSIAAIWNYGPISMAYEDPAFHEDGVGKAKINTWGSIAGLDPEALNLNSGVLLLTSAIRERAERLRAACFAFLNTHAAVLRYPDQAVFNWLVQNNAQLFSALPVHFNCHWKNPKAQWAPLVHAFGAYKLWNDGLTQACFPEWQRDYARWCGLGGSSYGGEIENVQYRDMGLYNLLSGFLTTMENSETALKSLAAKLECERQAKERLLALLQKVGQ